MGAILAVVSETPGPESEARLERMIRVSPYRGVSTVVSRSGMALAVQSSGSDASIATGADLMVAFHGKAFGWEGVLGQVTPSGPGPITDAQALLQAFEAGLSRTLGLLSGEWAFVAMQPSTGTVIVSRDVVGCRPLFHAMDGGCLVLASEIRQVVRTSGARLRLDTAHLGEILRHEVDDGASTPFEACRRVQAGHLSRWQRGRLSAGPSVESYWEAPKEIAALDPGEDAEELTATLQNVSRRIFDVGQPCAISLSGGLDSASVLASAVQSDRHRLHALRAYTLSYPGWDCDEAALAAATARHLNTPFRSIDLGERSLVDETVASLRSLDAPAPGTIHQAFALADVLRSEGEASVFIGHGGDEWLAGSIWFPAEDLREGRVLDFLVGVGTASRHSHADLLRFAARCVQHSAFRRVPLSRRTPADAPSLSSSTNKRWRPIGKFVVRGPGEYPGRERIESQLAWHRAGRTLEPLEQAYSTRGIALSLPLMHREVIDFGYLMGARRLTCRKRPKELLRRVMSRSLPPDVLQRSTNKVHYTCLLSSQSRALVSGLRDVKDALHGTGLTTAAEVDRLRVGCETEDSVALLQALRSLVVGRWLQANA